MLKTLVLYHANCTDGAGAMWAAWKYFADDASYIAVGHQSKKQDNILRRCRNADRIFMCDMMLEIEDIKNILDNKTEVNILDHHISNIEKLHASTLLEDYPGMLKDFTDLERSGAGITWDHFHGGSRPAIIDYIEAFDLWHWALPDSASIHTYLGQFNWKNRQLIIDRFNAFEKMSPGHMAAKGAPLLEFKNHLISRNMKQIGRAKVSVALPTEFSRTMTTYNVPILNANQFISETGNIMCEGESFAIIWQVMKNGTVRISLRSDDDGTDVSLIAQHLGYGGGGHVRSSGTRFGSVNDMLEVIEFIDGR